MKKRLYGSVLAGILAAAVVSGCALKGSETAITVDDTEIKADVANFYARYTQAQYETYYSAYMPEDKWNSEASEGLTYEESVKSSVQDTLSTMILLEKHMGDYDVSITDEEKKIIQDTAQEFDQDNSLEDKDMVSGNKKAVERMLTLMAVQQKMQKAIEAGADTKVSDDEAAQKSMDYVLFSYKVTDESGASSDVGDDEKAELKKKAEALAADLKKDGDFDALAKKAGVEVSTVTFDKESASPDEALIKAADALKKGEVTDVVETDEGCYVAKVTSLLDRTATDARKDTIVQERKNELYSDTCEKWRKDAKITVNKDVWKKIDFNDLTVTMNVEEDTPYGDSLKTDDQVDLDAQEEGSGQ